MLDVESSLCNITFRILGQRSRSVKNVFLVISRRRIVVESRVSKYSFQDRPVSKFIPPIDMRPARLCNPSDCSCYMCNSHYTTSVNYVLVFLFYLPSYCELVICNMFLHDILYLHVYSTVIISIFFSSYIYMYHH